MKRILIVIVIMVVAWSRSDAQNFPKSGCTSDLSAAMFGEVDTTKPRGVGDNYHTWQNGSILLVKFMPGGSQGMREKVIQNAKEWEKYANVTFKFVADSTSSTDIRIQLGRGKGHNSAVGTEARFRPQSQQTVNFDTLFFADQEYYLQRIKNKGILPPYNWNHLISEMKEDPNHWNLKEVRRVVMHEFGHVLGLLHEQSYPGAIHWKKTDSVYDYYSRTQGWNKDKVDFNVFNVASQFYTNGTQYDPLSIMHYAIESWQTTDGFSKEDNFELSEGDKKLVEALYPKNQKEAENVVPKVDVTNFGNLNVENDQIRKGLVIKPSFNLNTNSKLGEVYLVAQLADEDGYWIKTTGLYYNWGGVAATYLKLNLLPDTKVSYNKGGKINVPVELFLPYDYIPSLYGRKIKVVFSVYLDDVINNQRDKLMYFSMTNPLSIPTQ